MKRLIIVLAILALVVGVATFEYIYTANFYGKTVTLLEHFGESLYENKEHTDNPETIARIEAVEDYWASGEDTLMMFSNHMTVRSIQEKLAMLGEYTRVNSNMDVCACYQQMLEYVKDVAEEARLKWFNII